MGEGDTNGSERILEIILTEQRAMTLKLEAVRETIVDKHEFSRFRDRLESKLKTVDDKLNINTEFFAKADLIHKDQDVAINQNTLWIATFQNAGTWVVRSVFIAALGIAATILPAYLGLTTKKQVVEPLPSATPIVTMTPDPQINRNQKENK